ncbi:MAG: adenosine deaminase family protein [Candidatus Krumholzibacteriia bacterium]
MSNAPRTAGQPEITEDLVRALPKTDLHVHLDGSLRMETLIDLARQRQVELPSYTPEGLGELVFKERYANLGEYLVGFQYTTAVLRDPEALERVAYELARDNQEEGVRYIEVRFAPQLHVLDGLDVQEVCAAVDHGLSRAAAEFNAGEAVRDGREPAFHYGLIVCAMRMFTGAMSTYFRQLLTVHSESPHGRVAGLASLELARAAVRVRDESGLPIVAFDLAGQENGYPAIDHVEAYRFAHRHFLNKTVHAGEAYGPESIFQAITALHADRIGHGYHLFSRQLVDRGKVADPDAYVTALAEYIADRRTCLEVCITSNLQTNPDLQAAEQHPFREMLKRKLSVTLCTDNRLISRTSVTREILQAVQAFGLDLRDLKNVVIYGFKRSFFPGTYMEKRSYVRQAADHYEQVERAALPGQSATPRPSTD